MNSNVFTSRPVVMLFRAKKGTNVYFTTNTVESEAIFAPGAKAIIKGVDAANYVKGGDMHSVIFLTVEIG